MTQAVEQGKWVLIENIDNAPFDVISSIITLLETRNLPLFGRSTVIKAHDNFYLFATKSNVVHTTNLQSLLSNLFITINIENLGIEELTAIIESNFCFPAKIVEYIGRTITNLHGSGLVAGLSEAVLNKIIRSSRFITPRDIIKWCTRLRTFPMHSNLTEDLKVEIIVDSFSIFSQNFKSLNERKMVEDILVQSWGLTPSHISFHQLQRINFEINTTSVVIGSITLKIEKPLSPLRYIPTKQSLSMMKVTLNVTVANN